MNDHKDLQSIRRAIVRECVTQARLGRNNNELRLMGFADGCINEARRCLSADDEPYSYNNQPITD